VAAAVWWEGPAACPDRPEYPLAAGRGDGVDRTRVSSWEVMTRYGRNSASAVLAGKGCAIYDVVEVRSAQEVRRGFPSTAMADVKRSRQLSNHLASLVSAFRAEGDKAIEAHRQFFQCLEHDRDIALSHIADMLGQFIDGATQDAASWALRAIGQKATMPLVEALRMSEPGRTRSLALRMLEELGPAAKDAIPALADMLENDSTHREKAAEVLAAIGKAATPSLIKSVRLAEDCVVRCVAIEALGAIGTTATDAVPVLIERLRDEDFVVRMRAAQALGAIGAKEAVLALIESLRDEDIDVRAFAVEALGAIGPAAKDAAPTLVDMFRHENTCNLNGRFHHESVTMALRSIGPAAAPALRKLSRDKDSQLRERVREVLKLIGRVS
jgi:HEAT repeat protein